MIFDINKRIYNCLYIYITTWCFGTYPVLAMDQQPDPLTLNILNIKGAACKKRISLDVVTHDQAQRGAAFVVATRIIN
jgi:hypothetical protein